MTNVVAKSFKINRNERVYTVFLSATMFKTGVFKKYRVSIYEGEKLIAITEFDGLFNINYKKLRFFGDITNLIYAEVMLIFYEEFETPREFYKL